MNNNNGNNGNGSDWIGNFLDLVGIIIGYENLIENRQQTEANNIEKANQKQEQHILDDLHAKFDEQNAMLKYQTYLLEEILKILKGDKK